MKCKGYCGPECVNGNCPVAWEEDYAERGYDVIHNCEECWYNNQCQNCMFYDECSIKENENGEESNSRRYS